MSSWAQLLAFDRGRKPTKKRRRRREREREKKIRIHVSVASQSLEPGESRETGGGTGTGLGGGKENRGLLECARARVNWPRFPVRVQSSRPRVVIVFIFDFAHPFPPTLSTGVTKEENKG